jgi:hypothetical protein
MGSFEFLVSRFERKYMEKSVPFSKKWQAERPPCQPLHLISLLTMAGRDRLESSGIP